MSEQNTSGSELYQQLVHPTTTEYKGTSNNITTSIDNMHHITKGQPPNPAIYQKQKGSIKRGGASNQKPEPNSRRCTITDKILIERG
jgi:hypothetical protein